MTDDNQLSAKEKREIERAAAIVQREHRAAFQLARAALERASDPKEPHAALWAIAYFLSQVAIEGRAWRLPR